MQRRDWLKRLALTGAAGWMWHRDEPALAAGASARDPLTITGVKVTPIALPDPPILMSGGCHGPYFLRTIVEVETDAGIVGIGETRGGDARLAAFERAKQAVLGKNAFACRSFAAQLFKLDPAIQAGIELACLDACGKATGRRLCELLGGPVREKVEFAAYLFYRFASDDPRVLDDRRIVDGRGRGERALDDWGEVRTPEAMAAMAKAFQKRWGFRCFKLKAGVLAPDAELETLRAMHASLGKEALLRIDPNAVWSVPTSVRIGAELKRLPLEYYEDPVPGQEDMAAVRAKTGLRMSTNMCVTKFDHVPQAVATKPVDVVLGDHHGWGGMYAFQELGRLCETFGWSLSQHSNNHGGITMAAMIHAGAATPQLTVASDTHYVWLPEGTDVIAGEKLPIVGGHMQAPAGPGLGVNLDRDRLARANELFRKSGMTERDDAATMRRLVPGWKKPMY